MQHRRRSLQIPERAGPEWAPALYTRSTGLRYLVLRLLAEGVLDLVLLMRAARLPGSVNNKILLFSAITHHAATGGGGLGLAMACARRSFASHPKRVGALL